MYDPYTSTHTIIRVTVKKRDHLAPRFATSVLELKSRKGGKVEKVGKAGKGGKVGFGYAIRLLANMPKCHKMP